MEGPFIWKEPDRPYIYLFYSGSNTWGSTYAIGVARAMSIAGPWTKMGSALAHTRAGAATVNTSFVSPGHNSVMRKGGSAFIVYHAERWGASSPNGTDRGQARYMMVDRLIFWRR